LSHLRESGAIEQDADTVLFCHREGYYSDEKPPPGQAEKAELILAKNRPGRTGPIEVYWFGSYCRFENPAHGDDFGEYSG